MKKKAVAALLASVALVAAGCGSDSTKTTEKETQATEAATTEEATTEEATTEEATTEAASETESEAATTEEATSEAVSETETETASETETESEAATEEATTEEATTEEATTEAASETESEAATEEATTEEATTEAASEIESENATEEATTEEATTEAAGEIETETETEIEEVSLTDMPEYTALDYVTLGEYKGLTVTQEPIEITDEEIQEVIDSETMETLTEGTVEEGDIVNIDYEGTLDGEAFDGGSAEGYDLEIGSGTFIDGFEEGLTGLEIGSETDLDLTFPEDYQSEDLAGKDVVFHVTINSVQRVPELTDEVAAKVADGKTAEEYKESVRQDLIDTETLTQEQNAKYDLIDQVYENATIDGYPEEKLEFYTKYAKYMYAQQAEAYGMTLEDMCTAYGMTEEEFMTSLEDSYKEMLSQEMVLKAVAETEKLEVTDEEYQAGVEKYAEELSVDEDALVDQYGEQYLRDQLTLDKALDFLYDNANITTETTEEETTEAVSEEVSEEVTTEAESETVTEAATTEAESETATETEAATTEAATTEAES